MPAKTPRSSGRFTLDRTRTGALLRYEPSKSEESLELPLSRVQVAEATKAARRGDPAALRDLLLTEEARARTIEASGLSALVAANTWRWALPLFGGPPPAGRSGKGRQ